MIVEERLKELILQRYNSVREFGQIVDIPNSTLISIFKRGVGNASVSNIIKICKELKISADELAEGRITPIVANNVTESIEINDILADTKERLIYGCGLTLDGENVDREDIEAIINAMDIGVEMAIKNNKNHNKMYNKNITESKKIH